MTILRRLFACVTAVCLLIGCCSCFPVTIFTQNDLPDPNAYITEFRDKLRYKALSDDMKACYGTIYTALTDAFDTDDTITIAQEGGAKQDYIGVAVTLPHSLGNMTESKKLFNAIVYDNPHFFYLSNVYGLEGYEKDGASYFNRLLFTYTMDAATRMHAKGQLDSTVQAILQNLPKTSDDYDAEWYLHEQLVTGCTYDHDASENGFAISPTAYTAYGALVEGKAVCEGYSRAMQLLLEACDIPCTLVIGESVSNGEQHMWNYVTINGQSYHLDATWNDSSDTRRHNYFNVTTEQVALSHRIADGQDFLEICTATTDNFYHRNGLFVNTYQRQQIAAIIAEHVRAGETQVELFFAADKFDSALLFLKNRSAASEMVNAHLADSGCTLWDYALYGETDEHILILRKKQK